MFYIKRKNKKCPKCGSKYSYENVSNMVLKRVVSTKADVSCTVTCPKCHHQRDISITINAPAGKNSTESQLLLQVKKYFK